MAITISGTAFTMNDSSTIVSTTTHLAIGSYAGLGMGINGSSLAAGATIAGTSLRYNMGNRTSGFNGSIGTLYHTTGTGTAASGTWRGMDGVTNNSAGVSNEGIAYWSMPCLCARVS